jgi:pimeloyl-ACP methyl ester carboxylesterase
VIAEELHEALGKAGLAPPYVLAGWSLGGAFVRVFASMYSTEVKGVVLVDPVQEDFYARAEREHPEAFAEADKADVSRMNAGPQGERAELAAFDSSLSNARDANATLRAPVILLSSARTDLGAIGAIWTDEQRKWASRQRAKFVMVEGAGHAIHRQRPDAVITALRELLNASPRERE